MLHRKYATAGTVDGVRLITRGAVDFKINPTLASGDVKVSKDGGAYANLATLPTVTPAGGAAVEVALSAAELTAKRVVIDFVDQTSPKEWEDERIIVETYGNVNAQIVSDLDSLHVQGSGSVAWTVTAQNNQGAKVAGADVWLTEDSGGSIVRFSGTSDANGNVNFNLDSGKTYYAWVQLQGTNFTNPTTIVVP